MKDRDRSLKDILMEILKEYDFKDGPLFNLKTKLRLHSSLKDKSPFLENGDLDKEYIEETVEKASDIYRHLDFKGDLLLVYDNIFNENPDKEVMFIESILVNLKRQEEYTYEYFDEDEGEILNPARRIYQVQGFIMKDLFRQISLTDFAGDYDLASSIYIIHIKSKTIFYFYDDRGLYIMAREEKILNDLWEILSDYFFEDCNDFEIKIKKLYWLGSNENNKEELSLHGDLEIRLNDEIIKYYPTVTVSGLRLLGSLFHDHEAGKGNYLFPFCENITISNEELDKAKIIGCDEGLDWSVSHKNGLVTIKEDENIKTTYYYLQYKKEVLGFIKEVENFYEKSRRKILSEDKIGREDYIDFWSQWKTLKEKASLE